MRLRYTLSKMFATPAGKSCRGRKLFGLLVSLMGIGLGLQAQEINVGNAVMSIPAGVTVTTDGGINLQNGGGIANDGTLEIGGDWTNNGKGLVEGGKGRVVLNGQDQKIGGTNATAFQDLELEGGKKELLADIHVAGELRMADCAVITHDHAPGILNPGLLNVRWTHVLVIAEPVSQQLAIGTAFERSAGDGRPAVLAACAAAPAGSSTSPRCKSASRHPAHAAATTRLQSAPTETMSLLATCREAGLPGNGATAALHAMYFSSEADGHRHKNEWNETTRQLDVNPATASSFLEQHIISFISA